MPERNDLVTFKGDPVTLVDDPIAVGQAAPDSELTAIDFSPRRLSDYEGKVKIVSVVPSLDTSVCDTQTRAFNEKATELSEDVVVLTISMDLPPAQKRWCGAAGVERVETLSDYKHQQFGRDTGLRIKELGLLARTVMVLDRENQVRYVELIGEIATEPDYDAAIAAAKELV
ncbi:MAG: thiol peroxidase [Phycisphaeraceae bacterium]